LKNVQLKRSFFLFVVALCSGNAFAQRQTYLSRSELGAMIGGMYYIGDLNQSHFNHTNLAGSLVYRFNIHSRTTWRSNISFGSVEGYDSESDKALEVNRNLSFKSNIFEIATGVEFNYSPFQVGHDRYKGTGYLLAQIALMHMNPKTELDGDDIELQPLGTEGQGTSLSGKGNYLRTQLAIPLGVGYRFSVGKNLCIGVEYGIRFLFTDYLDDVGAYRYADPVVLAAENGPLAAELSNRSLDGSRYGRRGNPTTRDWYTFTGLMITYKLGQPKSCWF
jgi:hypothetical protein